MPDVVKNVNGWRVTEAGISHQFFTADAAEDFIDGPLIDPEQI